MTKATSLKKGASAHRTMGEILDDLQKGEGYTKQKTVRKGGSIEEDAGSQIRLFDVVFSEIDPEE